MKTYDYLIVGAGLFGSVFAAEAKKQNKTCLVIDKRDHIAGNTYTKKIEGIDVHIYGAHIFHTNNKFVWDYVNNLTEFNRFTNAPVANYNGRLFNLPFNMNTFYQMWQTITPDEAKQKISEQQQKIKGEPKNLEEQAIKLVGTDIYELLIKDYTEKQWGRPCNMLPPFIIKRLPVRFTYDNNYFNDRYQGIPINGYSELAKVLLKDADVKLNVDFFKERKELETCAKNIVYTGPIDEYFDYTYGALEWRTLRFETEILDKQNQQGVAVMNYTDKNTPYTRIIEHKHFNFGTQEKTVITKEYSKEWTLHDEPYYPINDEKNQERFLKYKVLANQEKNVYFGGRLAEYTYYNMDQVISRALDCSKQIFNKNG